METIQFKQSGEAKSISVGNKKYEIKFTGSGKEQYDLTANSQKEVLFLNFYYQKSKKQL